MLELLNLKSSLLQTVLIDLCGAPELDENATYLGHRTKETLENQMEISKQFDPLSILHNSSRRFTYGVCKLINCGLQQIYGTFFS